MTAPDEPRVPEPGARSAEPVAERHSAAGAKAWGKRIAVAVVLVYLISLVLPVYRGIYGWQAFGIGIVLRPIGWFANFGVWLGAIFLAQRKPRAAAIAGFLGLALGATYFELLFSHRILLPDAFSVGYFCWLASAALVAGAGAGLRWYGPGRRSLAVAAATVAICMACLVGVEHFIVVTIGPPSQSTLTYLARSEDAHSRLAAVRKLGIKRNPELVPNFIEAANDPDDKVRQYAIGALGDIGPPAAAAVPTLISILSGPPPAFDKKADPKRAANSRSAAAAALGNIGPAAKEAVPALIAGLKDQNVPVRRWSATSLGEMRTEGRSSVPALVQALHDPDAQVRRYTIQSLQKIGVDHDSLPALTPSLHDSDDTVRETAAALLKGPVKSP
jgi:HEAT repeat protein